MSNAQPTMPPLPDYYEILQVHPRASQAVIKKAYRTLLMELGHHPDRGGDPAVAALITEAYHVLGDPERRAEYDRLYFGQPGEASAGPRPTTAGSSLIVLCPRCRTKNRVRSQEVLDIAKCSRCGQKLSRLPNPLAEHLERLRGELDRAIAALRRLSAARRPAGAGASRERPVSRVLTFGVPLALLAASAAATIWALTSDPLVGDPIQAADRLEQEMRHDEARLLLHRAIGADPANPRLHEKLGETYLSQKVYAEAAHHFGEAARYNADNAHVQARRGRALYLMGRLGDAEAAYKQALRIDPSYAPALFDLGNIHTKRQRFDDAAECFERALRIERSADLYYNLGLVRKWDDQADGAIQAFKSALREDPNHRASMVQLAELYNTRGQFELAAAQYVTASQLKHEDVDLHLKLATIYERTGQTRLAIEEWNVCLLQGKHNPAIVERARRALTKLGAPPAS